MIAGVVHQDGKLFWFDDIAVMKPSDIPRDEHTANTVWYTTSKVSMKGLISLMGEEDEAFGPNPDNPIGCSFMWTGPDGKKKTMKVMKSSVWGVSSADPVDTENQIMHKMMTCSEDGIKPSSSAASTALSRYMRIYDGKHGRPKTRQLPPRWRELAHASFHGGPIAITKAYHEDLIHIDMRGAYLEAMKRPLPVYGLDPDTDKKMGGYCTFRNATWEDLQGKTGFAEATVYVKPEVFGPMDVPPLPIRHFSGGAHPVGFIRGAWPICMLEDAVEAGEVEVVKIHQFAWAPETMPLFEGIAADFQLSRQGKLLYTRFWGKWASKGGYSGHKTDNPPDGSVRSHGLWWEHTGVDGFDYEAPATYRPDLAAMIAGYNHQQIYRVVRRLKKGSIAALYVDAIWTSDIEGAEKIVEEEAGEWAVKARGPARFYGPGVYQHGDRMAAAGYDAAIHGELTPEKLQRWAASPMHKGGNLVTNRIWNGHPGRDPTATSIPMKTSMSECIPACTGPDVHSEIWTPSGWVHQETLQKILESDARKTPGPLSG
jgi:hypothetical protein